jgi:hypothetical protein
MVLLLTPVIIANELRNSEGTHGLFLPPKSVAITFEPAENLELACQELGIW